MRTNTNVSPRSDSHLSSPPRRPSSPSSRFLLLLAGALSLAVAAGACGDDSGMSQERNEENAALAAMDEHVPRTFAQWSEVDALAFGENGYAARTTSLRTMPLDTGADARAWVDARAELRAMEEEIKEAAARASVAFAATWDAQRAFLEARRDGFPMSDPEGSMTVFAQVEDDTLDKGVIVTGLALITFGVAGYKFIRGFGDLAQQGDDIVHRTASESEAGRQFIENTMRNQGISVPAGASADELQRIHREQDRYMRPRITGAVESGLADRVLANDPQSDAALGQLQQSRDNMPDIAVQGGELGVRSTVSFSQSGTGSVGGLQGGVAGAVADLAMEVTSTTPADLVDRSLTITVRSRDSVPTDIPPSTRDPEQARDEIRQVSEGGAPQMNWTQMVDAANALTQQLWTQASQLLGRAGELADRVILMQGQLQPGGRPADRPDAPGAQILDGAAELPGFQSGENVDVLIQQPGHVPVEVDGHRLGPDNPLRIDALPRSGTMSVEAEATGDPNEAGEQSWRVDVSVSPVPEPTRLRCSGTNVVCSPGTQAMNSSGTFSFALQVFERAQVRIVREDSGEAYTFVIRAASAKEEPAESCADAKAHLCMRLPQVGCDISIMDTARARVIAACGAAEANRYFAVAPSQCC